MRLIINVPLPEIDRQLGSLSGLYVGARPGQARDRGQPRRQAFDQARQ